MRPSEYDASAIIKLLKEKRIAALDEVMGALGTSARRTVFRKLAEVGCRTSYSHRGRYYTVDEVAVFDELGLWSWRNVWFSVHGTLLATAAAMIDAAEMGLAVDELDNLLHVRCKDAVRQLVLGNRISRKKMEGRFVYCAADPLRRRQQLVARRARLAEPGVAGPIPEDAILPEELRAAIVLFFSMLDEKQRRLYAGLESIKTGRGGDARIAGLLGINRNTVARGRRELLDQDVEIDRVRKGGGGRPEVEKKRQR
jgi:hypothetical protein